LVLMFVGDVQSSESQSPRSGTSGSVIEVPAEGSLPRPLVDFVTNPEESITFIFRADREKPGTGKACWTG